MEGGTMRGDERVGPFRDGRETGQVAVEREPVSFAGSVAERQEAGLGGAGATPVRLKSASGMAGCCAATC